jgi:four helix bundle protein
MTLKIYPVVLELVRLLAPCLEFLKSRSSSLGDQFERALTPIPLTVAEGAYSRGKTLHARYQTALASAREALSCWETAQALGWVGPLDPDIAALFKRVIGTLVRLIRPKLDSFEGGSLHSRSQPISPRETSDARYLCLASCRRGNACAS